MRLRPMLVVASLALGASCAPPASAADAPPASRSGPSWLGVSMDAAADGVVIRHVVRQSPADRAGLREGDRIVRIEGVGVARASDVTRAVSARAAGDVVTLGIVRGGRDLSVKATLEVRPTTDDVLRKDYVGAHAPAWSSDVAPVAGAPTSLSQLRGRVVLVDFWATWCGPCRLMAPRLSGLQARYGAQGLTVVGITTDSAETAAVFARKTEMRYGIVTDPQGETLRAYGVTALPTMFVIDKRGVVREIEAGFDPSGTPRIEQLIVQLLAEPTAVADAVR